jgi:hypothetical protein
MPTFIDESGDTGHSRHSLDYFRMTAIWVANGSTADAIRTSIRQLRSDLGLSESFEFKFTRLGHDLRSAFFEVANGHGFRFAVCAIDKTKTHWVKAPASEQHWAAATALSVDLRPLYHGHETAKAPLGEQIVVDDNGDKQFLEAIKTAFRGLGSRYFPGIPMVANPRFRNSKSDEMLQLADMVCGAVGAAIDGNDCWLEIVKAKCVGRTDLP